MAFWNRTKGDIDSDEITNAGAGRSELTDELKAITEALEEAKSEKLAKAKAREEESAKILKERAEAEERVRATASEYIKGARDKKESGGQHFFMLVEGPSDYLPEDEKNFLVEGNVYGEIKKGDKVYLFNTDNSIITTEVMDIRTGPSLFAESAEDKHCVIELDGSEIKEINKFTVLTNAEPETVESNKRPISNPRILGLSLDFHRYSKDPEFFTVLINAIVRGRYLTHASVEKLDNEKKGKTKIGIMSITDSNAPDKRLVPVYTDHYNMGRSSIKNTDGKLQVLGLGFPEIARFASADQHEGFVINPFGPVAIKIPKGLVKEILENPTYKDAFENKKNSVRVEEQKISDKTQIFIGVPPETGEYGSIRNAVSKYCQTNGNIKRAGIVMKLEKGKSDASYLCIVDCPKGMEKECYTGIFAAVRPFLNNYKKMDFMRYEEAVFAVDNCGASWMRPRRSWLTAPSRSTRPALSPRHPCS